LDPGHPARDGLDALRDVREAMLKLWRGIEDRLDNGRT
jgi:hypothetical protein